MTMEKITLKHGCGIELLEGLATGSVDMILTDPPFGTTRCAWDKAPDWPRFFAAAWRALKPNGALLLFAQMPLAADLVCMQRAWFRYQWIWEKPTVAGVLNANRMPLRVHEVILTFYRALPKWNRKTIPGQEGRPYKIPACNPSKTKIYDDELYNVRGSADGSRCPRDVLHFAKDVPHLHPTQKPLALLGALIEQYTDEGETVCDPFAGSASTLLAASNLGRCSIGAEKDPEIYQLAQRRISARQAQLI